MDRRGIQRIVKEALSVGRKALTEPEAKELVGYASIAVPRRALVKGVAEAVEAAAGLGYPVALKVVSPDMLHKSDAGGVILGIGSAEELQMRWAEMVLGMADEMPTASVEGFLIEEMVSPGTEVIVGGIRDEQFGAAVMFGLGGVAVELLKDVSIRLAPVTREEAFAMIGEVRSFPLLAGYRGGGYKDLDAIAEAIMKIGQVMGEVSGIRELEINPLVVYEKGAVAVDARAVLG